jgi:L-2,4-diaminobutyric acid acetyltransferase
MSDAARTHIFQEQSAPAHAGLLHGVWLRQPKATDAPRLLELVSACTPLDVNSLYCYLILCTHFHETCVVAERGGEILGFVSGYREPPRPDALFCWQVAVAAKLRRSGLASAMLRSILSGPANRGVRTIEASVTGSNHGSMRLFRRLADDLGAPCRVEMLFSERDFAPWEHDAEWLVRIGPFDMPCDLARSERAGGREAPVSGYRRLTLPAEDLLLPPSERM